MGVLPVLGTPSLRSSSNESGDVPGSVGASSDSFAIVDNVAFAIPLGAGLSTLALLTFFGNAMVVHAIRTERKLHTVSNMFILSLAIADLTVGLVVMPLSSTYVLFGDWILGLFVCQLWLVIDYTASTASIFNLLILSLDRYWSIRSPLKYLAQRTKKRALAMIAIVWMISALWAIPIIGWHQWYNSGVRKHPNLVCETEFSDSVAFKITTSIANFIIPMSLMVILYYKIFREIKRRGNISDIGRSINRVSCAQHRGANKENSFTASLRHTFDGSFHTSSSSNASKARFKLKMSSNKAPTQLDSASVTLHHSQGDCATCIKPTVPRHTLLRRLLDPFIKNGTNQALSAETSTKLTSGIKSSTSTVARNGTVGGNGSVPTASTTFTTMTNELCHSASATALATAAQQILVSSPSPVKVTASEDLVPVESSRTQLTPLIREMRREQLSRDNGHRIMRMSVHCPKCTYSLVSQIVSDQSSGEHKSVQTNHCGQNNCLVKELFNDQYSAASSQSQSPTSSLSSQSVRVNSECVLSPTQTANSPCSSSTSSSLNSPSPHSAHQFPSSQSHTSNRQFVPQSASSANIHRCNSLQIAHTKQQQLKSSHDPIIVTDPLTSIAYYKELTLMSLQTRPLVNELDNKATCEEAQNFTSPNSQIVQSKSSFEFSNTHYSGVNVQVEYVDQNGLDTNTTNLLGKCRIMSMSASNVSKQSSKQVSTCPPNKSKPSINCASDPKLIALSHSRSCVPLSSSKETSPTNLCPITSACPTVTKHQHGASHKSTNRANQPSTKRCKESSSLPLNGVNDSKQDGDQSRSCNADSDGTFQSVTNAMNATQSLIAGSSLTTNTATTVMASSIIGKEENSHKSKIENKSIKTKSSKKIKRSSSNTSPNSDEICNESLRLSPVEQMDSCHSNKSQCSKCGFSLSKSISQASNISNVHVGQTDEKTSIRSSASVHSVPKSRPNAMSLMSVPKHSGQLNSFTNLPMLASASKSTLSKQLSSKSYSSFRESFRVSTNSFKKINRVRKNSFNQPANSFCADCASLASAVSAAARHRQELRREESSRLRQEKKAARQLGVILGAFILCWMPYIITYVVTASCTNCVSLTVHQVTIWLGYLNSFLNPFLYALCNENFKHAFKKMLGRMPAPQHLSYNYDQNTIGGTVGGGSINKNGTTTGGTATNTARTTNSLRLEPKLSKNS